MVRPIEMTDTLSKVGALERMQQAEKVQVELIRQQQRTLADKLLLQSTTTNPVPQGDQVELHTRDRERINPESEQEPRREKQEKKDRKDQQKKGRDGRDHIDITV